MSSIFRSYLSKNNTLIERNRTNNSQNPVTEISYGTVNSDVSRFIFDIDLEPLKKRIESGEINLLNIGRHTLNISNAIRYRDDLIGKKFADCVQQRTGSFTLELFNVDEDWDEGNGYKFVYVEEEFPSIPRQASNWFDRKTNIPWSTPGAYTSGQTQIIATQGFEKGNENIIIDITDYVNAQIFSGSTGFTGTTFGLGLKFTDDLESLETINRQAVSFSTKYTPTYFEPYVETEINDTIRDDRNHFFMDTDNNLFLYANIGNQKQDIIVNQVRIYDYNDDLITIVTGDSISNIRKGVYKITVNVDSSSYPDNVIFRDVWDVNVNGLDKEVEQEFYLISSDNYFFNQTNIDSDNYFFILKGIAEKEIFKRGLKRKVKVEVKEFYPNQSNNLPLDLEYRIYNVQSEEFQIDVIPFTKLDRTSNGYEFTLDTSWLIPQDYIVEVRLISDFEHVAQKVRRFTIASDGAVSA